MFIQVKQDTKYHTSVHCYHCNPRNYPTYPSSTWRGGLVDEVMKLGKKNDGRGVLDNGWLSNEDSNEE